MDGPDLQHRVRAALDLVGRGRLDEAEAVLRAVLSADTRQVDALHLLGLIGLRRGQPHGALALLQRAVQVRPADPATWNTLGECYRAIGQLDAAVRSYRAALDHDPRAAAAHVNLALALLSGGHPAGAVDAARAALAVEPDLVAAHNVLGQALRAAGDWPAATAALRRAVELDPADAAAHNNLGTILEATDHLPEALDSYRRAAGLAPGLAVIANNYLNVLRQLNRWGDALAWTDQLLAADPAYAPARWNRGLLRLTHGDYAGGLPDYELRFTATDQRHPSFLRGRPWTDPAQDVSGLTVLLYAEQGFGDGFQAARYVPAAAARAGRVVVLCHPQQARLFAGLPGVAAVVTAVEHADPYDRFAALMSLPFLCRTRSLANVPAAVPYLSPPPDVADRWRARLAGGDGLKVGLVWAGAARPDPLRTVSLAELSPILAVAGVRWFSLQVGPAAADLSAVPAAAGVTDLSPELSDFADTAAAMNQLDLIVTIDTGACHLSGALGRPTWTLLPFSPDWRWLLDRDDSPWYPTMRLFRQAERKRWGPVADRVAGELRARIEARGSAAAPQ